MKKNIALFLIAALMLGLCACGSGNTPASSAPVDSTAVNSEAAAPAEETAPAAPDTEPASEALSGSATEEQLNDVAARLAAGEEVLVGYAVNTLSNPALKQTIDNVQGFLEDMGCTVSVVACEGDTALMINHIENFIEMQVDLIIVAPIDQDAMQDSLLKAEAAGIPVIFNGQYPAYADQMSGGGTTDYPELGVQTAKSALAWIDQQYPDAGDGDIHVAVLGFNNTYIFKQIYDNMIATIEADPRITVSYTATEHNSIDSGFNAAAEAMTMDPEIRVFLCYQDSPGIGVANYLMSQSDLNMDEFGVFSGSYSDTSTEMVDDPSNPTRCILYYGIYGNDKETIMGYDIFFAAREILLGHQKQCWLIMDMWSHDSFGYNLLIDHPENDHIYD